MLRRDTIARFEKTGVWVFSRYRFIAGGIEGKRSLSRAAFDALMRRQFDEPLHVCEDLARRRICWLFREQYYWYDDGYSATQVKALILQRLSQKDRRLKHALALMDQTEAIEAGARPPIPDDVRVFVWQRDGGSCVSCGSRERLEFDHMIPVALGGSNTARNLQLLCETCNRQKGASLV